LFQRTQYSDFNGSNAKLLDTPEFVMS